MESEQLLSLRNAFYSGNHANVQTEVNDLFGAEGKVAVMRDVYLYRSLMEHKHYDKVFAGITRSSPMGLQAVRLHATFKDSSDDNREMVLEQLREWCGDIGITQDKIFSLVASQIWYEAQDYKEALRLVHGGEALEMQAMLTQIFLKLNRLDLAEKQIVKMQEADDDDVLTALAITWVSLAKGGDALHTANEMINELVEKFTESVLLTNLLGVCRMKMGDFAEAFTILRRARELAKESNEPVSADTLINSIVCVQHLNKHQLVGKVESELRELYPTHAYFTATADIEKQFNAAAIERA